jgi:hypothetical protein
MINLPERNKRNTNTGRGALPLGPGIRNQIRKKLSYSERESYEELITKIL